MFAVISRGGSIGRNAYICSSCLGHVDPQLARLSRITNANATFSTTFKCRQVEGEANEGATDAPSGKGKMDQNAEDGNGGNTGTRRRSHRRMSARNLRREQPRKWTSGASQNLSKTSPATFGKDETTPLSISNSDETLAALKEFMLAEVSREDTHKRGGKKEAMAKEVGQNTSGTSEKASSPLEGEVNISKSSKPKPGVKAKEGESEIEIKYAIFNQKANPKKTNGAKKKDIAASMPSGPAKSRKSPTDTSNAKATKTPGPEVRKIAATDSKDGIAVKKTKTERTASTNSSPKWARKWIDAIANNKDGGSGFKRAILLKLIEKGNLSPEDVGPAVTLLRNAIQEDQKRQEFQSLQQLPFQSIRQAMQGTVAPEGQPSSTPRISRRASKGSPMTPIKPRSKVTGEKVGGKAGESNALIRGTTKHEIETINASDLKLVPLDVGPLDVPKLSYGLERVLFNPGVYQLQDPRSRVFNFDPYLQTIMPVSEFDFNALKQYITSSRDTTLLDIAKAEKRKYTGSTSSMTSALGHFHFLLSQWRPINPGILSRTFPVEFSSFTLLQRGPTAIFLRYKDGIYAIDADKEFDTANILSSLGKSMEKLLTLPTKEFERYRKPNSDISEEERNEDEAFHYTTMGDFLMRSQLDAYDPRLPGTGMFDLKTRAVVSIRMDTSKYEEGSGYEIRQRHGEWESFEREYYDMIRAAFLKYSLQVRMGRMDGIFVAFHNTERIFGFQYVSLSEMDYALHGTDDTKIGDSEFKLSLDLLNRVLDRATAKYPEKSLRLFFETREADTPFMYIFAEPVEEKEIDQIQTSNKAEIEEFESRVLGLEKEDSEEENRQAEWDSLHSKVEETMDKDESGLVLDEEEGIDDRRSDPEIWDEDERRKVEDFIKTAAQEVGSEEEDDEDEDVEDSEMVDVEEEDGDKDDELVDDQHEDGDQENDINGDEEAEEGENGTLEEPELEANEEEDSLAEQSDEKSLDDENLEDSARRSGDVQGNQDALEETTAEPVQENAATPIPKNERAESSHDTTLFAPPARPTTSDVESSASDDASATNSEITEEEDQIFAMTLTIRNKVNGKYLQRPTRLDSGDNWTVEYSLAEVKEAVRARKLYNMAKERRSKTLRKSTTKNSNWNTEYVNSLMKLAKKGRKWRKEVDAEEKHVPKKVLDVRDVGEGNSVKEE